MCIYYVRAHYVCGCARCVTKCMNCLCVSVKLLFLCVSAYSTTAAAVYMDVQLCLCLCFVYNICAVCASIKPINYTGTCTSRTYIIPISAFRHKKIGRATRRGKANYKYNPLPPIFPQINIHE